MVTQSPPVPPHFFRQAGVLALRAAEAGPLVLLLTSQNARRWVIPKGVVEQGSTAAASAEREAWEEGGVRGRVARTPLGAFSYAKWGGVCTVEVFRMDVTEEADDWPEAAVRRRRWVRPAEAGGLVEEPGLRRLLTALGQGAEAGEGGGA